MKILGVLIATLWWLAAAGTARAFPHWIAASTTGVIAAISDDDTKLLLFAPGTTSPMHRIDMGGKISFVAISRDGRTAAAGAAGHDPILFAVATGKALFTLDGAGDTVAIAFSPTGDEAATVGADGFLRGWEVATGKMVWPTAVRLPPGLAGRGSAAFSPSGNVIAASNGHLGAIVDAGTGAVVARMPLGFVAGFINAGSEVVLVSPGIAYVDWTLPTVVSALTGKRVRWLDLPPTTSSSRSAIAISDDGSLLAAGDFGATEVVAKAAPGDNPPVPLQHYDHRGWFVFGAAFGNNDTELATTSIDGVLVWDVLNGTQLRRLNTN
jgi:WD40 repeat protein